MSIQDKISDAFNFFSKRRNINKIYDTSKKQLDLSKMLTPEDLYRVISDVTSNSYGSTVFNKFFDLNLGRADRYSEYDQIYYRIPEAAACVHILVDLILSPNLGDMGNQLRYFPKPGQLGNKAELYSKTLLEQSTLVDHLPKIIFNSLLYGDCFVSSRKTNFGLQYTIHETKETSILFDRSTGINLGIVVRNAKMDSAMDKILSMACPSISLDLPRNTVGIVAKKIKTVRDYDYNIKVKEIEDLIGEMLLSTSSNNSMIDFKYYPPGKYTSFSIFYNNFYHPYGTSIYDPLRAVAKQLLLTESALSIYRMTRAPLRYKFLVEMGGVPEKNIRGMLNSIKDSIKKERVISDNSNNSIDSIPDMIAPEEDFWIPVMSGQPQLDIVPLDGGSIEPYIGDVEYFKRKFIGGLGMPPSYLGMEEGTSTRALLTLEDMRLTRTIKKYQRDINVGLTELNNNNLQLAEVPELIGQVQVQLPSPQNLEDNVRVENIASRVAVGVDFQGLFPNVPKLWIMKNIVCLTQNEIDDMETAIEEQAKYSIFAENKPGKIGPDGEIIEPSVGGGGGGGDSFGSMDDDMGDFSTDTEPDFSDVENGDSDLEQLDFKKSMDDLSSNMSNGTPGEGEISL